MTSYSNEPNFLTTEKKLNFLLLLFWYCKTTTTCVAVTQQICMKAWNTHFVADLHGKCAVVAAGLCYNCSN